MKWLIVLFTLFALGCNKYHSCEECELKQATIYYTGPIGGDGCEWMIRVDGIDAYYHADVLSDELKVNELRVRIRYEKTGEDFICGIASTRYAVIHILNIRK